MITGIGVNTKSFRTKVIALLVCATMIVQLFWTGGVAHGASPYYFRGYDIENITASTFLSSGATISGSTITMTDSDEGEAVGSIALNETGHDISTSIDLGGLEIDFSTMTTVTEEGTSGAQNDVPTVQIAFCRANYSSVISTVDLAKPNNAVSGSVALGSTAPIPVGTRTVLIYLRGKNTSGSNTVVFQNTSFIIRDAAAPACSVGYNDNWTNQSVTVTISASDGDSGLEGIYKDGVRVSTTSPYTFTATANTSFTAYSKDYAGKVSDTRNITIGNIDKTAPAAPASLVLSNTAWTNTDVSVTVPALGTSSGAPERYVYRLDSGSWTNMPANFAITASGQFALEVAVEDAAGNRSSSLSGTVKIDKIAPSIDDVDMTVSSGNVDVTVTTSEGGLSGVKMLRYAEGSHDAAYFTGGGGTDIAGGHFAVSAGGLFTIYIADNAGNYDIGGYTLNTAPTLAHTGDVEMTEDVPETVVLTAKDGETSLSGLTVLVGAYDTSLISNVQTSQSDEQISLIITPVANKSGGPVAISVTIKDPQNESVSDTFYVTVQPVNDDPVAVDDEGIVTDEDASVKIDVLDNDYDTADGDTLSITDAGTPEHGTAAIAGGQIRYTPAADYNGLDEFTYTISDGHGGTASATVYISATAKNDAPKAVADTATVDEDDTVLIDVIANDTDIDGDDTPDGVISLYSVTNGAHGTAVIDGTGVRYTPATNFFGKDTFTYVVTDGGGLTATGTVTVTVKGTEDAPYFESLNTEYTIAEDSKNAEITFSLHDAETEAASLMLQAVSMDETQTLLKDSGIVISGLGDSSASVTLKITPVANAYGDVTVSLSLGDGFASVTKTFLLHISNVNDAPTVKQDEVTYAEDSASVLINTADLIKNDTDIDGDTLSFGGISTTTTVGTLIVLDGNTLQYTPKKDYDGTDSFTYIVSDGKGGTAVGTCVLKATPVNDAPLISLPAGPFSTDEDTVSAGIVITISDKETDAADLVVRASSGDTDKVDPDGLSIVNNGDGTCTLKITPMLDANGTATITVTVSDGSAASSEPLQITINPTPDAPVAMDDNIYVPLSGRRVFTVLGNDHDADGDPLTVVLDSWLPYSLNGQLTYNETTQQFTYRAANGEVGTGTFSYKVTDGANVSEAGTVTLTINSMMHAPELSEIAAQYVLEDGTTSPISITVTDEDLGDESVLTVSSSNTDLLPVDYDVNTVVTVLGGGKFTLTLKPVKDGSGTSQITVTATDSTGNTDSASFWLTVYATNDAPNAVNDVYLLEEDSSVTLKLAANDSDPEGDTIWVNGMAWPAHGYLYRSGGDYVYVPYGNWNGTEVLSYSVTDGQSSDIGAVTIMVTPVNDAPVNYSNWVELPNAVDASATATVNVLSGDYDPDGDTVRLYEIVSGPSYGEAEMDAATGKITYTRTEVSPNDNGADELTYRIIDRDTMTGDCLYTDAKLYIGIDFNSSLYTYHDYIDCYEDDPAFTFDLSIYNPNEVTYTLELHDTTALGTLAVVDCNTVCFTPKKDANGDVWIDYTVAGGGESADGSFHIRLYPVNDAPVIESDSATASCAEDSAGASFTVTFSDVDNTDSSLYFYAYAENADSTSPVALTLAISVNRTTGQAVVTAVPAENANGAVDIVVGVSDGMAAAEKTVRLTVSPVDDDPVPAVVSRTLYEDTEVTFSVVTSESDVDGDTLQVSIADGDGPANGTAVVNEDGTITYTPDADYYGGDSFVFTVTDVTDTAKSATQTAYLTVVGVNDQPEILDLDYYQTTKEDTPKEVTLTVTDVDNDLSEASHYTITSGNTALIPNANISIAHVSGDEMKITLTPAANAYGSAIITVVASDGELSAQEQFKLTVQPVNDSPVAADDTAAVDEVAGDTDDETSVTIDLTDNDTDVEPGTLKVIAITDISEGTVKNNGDGTVTYSADGDYNGVATFRYTVMDAGGETDTADVTVTVNAMNDPPRAENDTAATNEDDDATIAVLTNDSDAEGDTLSITAVSDPSHGTAVISGTNIVYTPIKDYNGSDSFTYTISDGHEGTDTATVTVSVKAVNDAPEIAKYPEDAGEWEMDEDTTESFLFTVGDAETAASSLIITIDSKDKTVIANTGIVLSTNEYGQKVITVTPLEDKYGVVPVQFKVSDGALVTTVQWNITIAPVNDAPKIKTTDVTTTEDKPVSGTATATDAENDALTFSAGSTGPEHGSVVVNAGGSYTYTPAANFSGTDSFDITVSDGNKSATGTVNVTVTPINDKPDAVNDTDTVDEDSTVVVPVTANDTDADSAYGDTLTVIAVTAPAHGTASIVEGGVLYAPAGNYNGTDSFSYTIKDSDGEKDTATVTMTVNPKNDAPANGNISEATDEDIAATITLPDGIDIDETTNPALEDVLIIDVDDPAHGLASIAGDGKSIEYTPDSNWFTTAEETEVFNYTVRDAGGVEVEFTITMTVNPVNDVPVFVSNPADMALTEDGDNGSSGFTVGDVETAAASLTVTLISSTNTALVDSGDVAIIGGTDGVRTVTVNPNDNKNGTAKIKLRVTDLDGGYSEYTFTVTVSAQNDNPNAQPDTAETGENTPVEIDVLENDDVDTDNEGDTLTLLTVSNATYGTVGIEGNKAVYTPDADLPATAVYTDSFTYTMKDASGATSGSTVTVTVTPENDAPVITDPIEDVTGIPEDSDVGTGVISFTVTDEEDDDDTLTVTKACDNTVLFPLSSITVLNPEGGTGAERTVQAIPAANAFGTARITLTVKDSKGAVDQVTFSVTVDSVDDEPSGSNDVYEVTEDIETELDVLANDDPDYSTNPEQLAITAIATQASHGTARVAEDGKSVFYKTAQDSNEDDWFTYTMHDSFSNKDYTFRVDITVIPVNDAPVVTMTGGTSFSTYESVALNDIAFTVTDVDNEVATLTLSAASENAILVLNGLHIDDGTTSNRTIDVQPYRKWNGTTLITITADDGTDEGTASFTFIVNNVNEAPVANNDTLNAPEDAKTFLDVLDNDTDNDLETNWETEFIIVSSVTDTDPNAEITKAEDGSGVYIQPITNYNGPVTFTYSIEDASGEPSNTATVTVAVTQVNDAPVADDEVETTAEDTPITIDVLDGDTDIDQDSVLNEYPGAETLSISLSGATAPLHGAVVIADGKLKYTPAANYNGPDSFTYYVTDGEARDEGHVSVTVTQVNDAPVAVNDTPQTDEDTPVSIDVLGNDTDVDTNSTLNKHTQHSRDDFTISLDFITEPLHGDIDVVSGEVLYTPDGNWFGIDTFTYFILDGHGGSAQGTVTVTVNSVNDLPVFVTKPADMELTEDLANGSGDFSVSDVETAAASLSVTVYSSSNPTLVATTDVSVTAGIGGARTVIVDPKNNQNGTANITLRVSDGNPDGYTDYTFKVDVAAVNDAPVGDNDSATIEEDTSYTVAWADLTHDVDIATNADVLGVTITTQAAHGTAEVVGGDIVYTPGDDWNGTDTFVYTVKDSKDAADTGTISVTVTQVNDAPVADDETLTTAEDTAKAINVLEGDTDVDQDGSLNADPDAEVLDITLTGAAGPSHGTAEITAYGVIQYTPEADYNGPDSFEYFVTDGEAQGKGVVTVTVTQVNDNPVAVANGETTEEETAIEIDVLANDTDVDTDDTLNKGTLHSRDDFSISLDGVTYPLHGDIELAGEKVAYTPDEDWAGTDTFTYFILDGHGGSDEGTVTVTVGGENDPPVAADDSASAKEDNTASVNVLDNDTDPDPGDSLSFVGFTMDTSGLHGTLTGLMDGTVTFVPETNWNGSFTVGYQMCDEEGVTDEAVITITIEAVNDAPTAGDFSDSTSEDTPKGLDVSTHIGDADTAINGDSLTVTVEAGDGPAHGSVSVSGTVITYTPDADWNGTDSFTYTVTDEADDSDTGIITVTVSAVNDAPVADEDEASLNEDAQVTVDVLDGDMDVDTSVTLNVIPQAAITLTGVGTPGHGSAVILEGKIVYTPIADFNGTDSFTYTVSDGVLTDTGTVTITVRPVNDNPIAEEDVAVTDDEDAVTIDVLDNDTDVDTDELLNKTPDRESDFVITAVGTPGHGTAVITDGKITYTPNDRFAGEDSFTYTMSDGHGGTAQSTVTVTVRSVNDPPETPVVHTPEGGERYGGASTVNVTWSGFDIDGDVLGYTLEYYDGSAWHVVQEGMTDTEYNFDIPETLTSITDLQFRVNASDAEFTSDYGYSGKVEVDKEIPRNILVTMKTADGRPYVAGTWTNQSVTVTAVSVEDASAVLFSYSIEDKVFRIADNYVVTSGVHTVYVRATDEFANMNEFGGYLARVDKQAPSVPGSSVTVSGPAAQIVLTLKGDPGGSGNSYLILPDGSKAQAASSVSWKAGGNGEYAFKLYDVAGNVTNFTVKVEGIDESAPVITCDSGSYSIGDTSPNPLSATLSFTDGESEITAKGYAVSTSPTYGGAYKSYTGAIEFAEAGTYYIHAYARNAANITANETFGPFIVALEENPGTGEEPAEEPPVGDVTVDVTDVAETAVKVRLPGGEWTDTLTLEGVEPGTYIIEVMDEEGNITTMEITITDEEIASGQWKPATAGLRWYAWAPAGFGLLLLLLLLFWRNVTVTVYAAEGEKALRSTRRLKRRKDEVIVSVSRQTARGGASGTVTLSKAFTKRMRGKTLIVEQEGTELLRTQVPEDADDRFTAQIERWVD